MATTTAAALMLPVLLGSNRSAAALLARSVPAGTVDVAVSAAQTEVITASADSELIKGLLALEVQRVVLVEPNEDVEARFTEALDWLARPERTLLLTTQRGRADALYRS